MPFWNVYPLQPQSALVSIVIQDFGYVSSYSSTHLIFKDNGVYLAKKLRTRNMISTGISNFSWELAPKSSAIHHTRHTGQTASTPWSHHE